MKLAERARSNGVYPRTVYRWFREGKMPVPACRSESGTIWVDAVPTDTTGRVVLCPGLDRQVAGLTSWATAYGYEVGEVGSGLDERRPKLRRVLSDPSASVVVVENRDRLAWFGVECARQRRLRDRKNTAARLGIQARAVQGRDIRPEEVEGLMAAPPEWLIAEQARRRRQIECEAKDRLRRELTDALVMSVHDAWFQHLKRATSDAEVDAIDKQWAFEVERVKHEARRMVDELTPKQVRARIDREQVAANQAGVYRATQLARRAFGGEGG